MLIKHDTVCVKCGICRGEALRFSQSRRRVVLVIWGKREVLVRRRGSVTGSCASVDVLHIFIHIKAY